MTDYGHDLRFGTFITPGNTQPELPVSLAQLSEQLGYDLVTFQDHPYQPGFLDTWTLLSWVAARTHTIHLSGNVLNLPLRPPAVFARAAASLDLLSDGRFELGLGAGGFWDAVGAMGGRQLTPGQGVDALSEAIDVIRGIWNVDDRSVLRVPGEYYHLDGAKRGPATPHPIPIWLGALKPRMLRLIGRKADGWLPSLMYLKPGELQIGNQTIDDAAVAAGRDPREIRRLANIAGAFGAQRTTAFTGPAATWVDDLLPLILDDGVSTVILASDDAATLRQFAEEVIPVVRERVASERSVAGTATGRVRGPIMLAQRREGIRYDELPASLLEHAVEPGDARYPRVRSTYLRRGAPGLVLPVRSVAQVAQALAFARAQHVPLGVRSGGHGISGRSTNDGGIVIDLRALASIEVLDQSRRLVRVGAGALWSEVAAALEPHGWALTSGDYGGVGVGGLATAGGVGWFAREHGLTIDHLARVHVVLADGSEVDASHDENPDLFWAMRGAGANFGIATSFDFVVDEVGDAVGHAQLVFDASDTEQFLLEWGSAIEAAPRELTAQVILSPPRGGRILAQALAVVDSSDPDEIIAALQPLADIAPLVQQSVQLVPYSGVMANVQPGDHDGQGEPVARSGLLDHITPEFAAVAASMLERRVSYFFSIRAVGEAVADVASEETAYANRSANFSVAAFGANEQQFDEEWDALRPQFSGLYLSFETDTRAGRLEEAFPGATLERLRELKARYDPDNVFRDNFNIVPLPVAL
jgi:alkanesulfonate monooxygenase SsuD/methylene tetrahydromethanopterin reductase-like flavin-dependent oxidoreductase (luciferase family)/FAD/FMN-containing dehydrogenase